MPYQEDLLNGQRVSIWAGDINSTDEVTEYFGQPFERDFGFLLDQDDLPVIVNSPMRGHGFSLRNPPLERVDIRELIEVISWSGGWADDAELSCRERGIEAAKLLVAFPHLDYRPDLCQNSEAPVRFIGCFPWPSGREDWEARLKAQVIWPPFPILRRRAFADGELFAWKGRVHLEAWKGFATREELADEFMSFRFSAEPDGDLGLKVSPLDNRQSDLKPTEAQVRAFQQLLDNQQALREAILNGIFSLYDGWRESCVAQGMPSKNMPKLSDPGDLVRIISPSAVHVLANEKEGFTHVGFGFNCKWDEEHALGVLTHKGHVFDIGQADTAFTDK
jgi:hypothetical protein